MHVYDEQLPIERKSTLSRIKQNQRHSHQCVNFRFFPTPDITTTPEIPNLIDIVPKMFLSYPTSNAYVATHPKFPFPPTQNLFQYLPCFHLLLFSAIEQSYSNFRHSCYQKQLSYGNADQRHLGIFSSCTP